MNPWLPHPDAEIHPAMPKALRDRQYLPYEEIYSAGLRETDFDPDEPYECWCGETGTYKELCDTSGLESTCGDLGTLNCFCGGDQCVCHHHGEIECPGCEECEDLETWER